MASIKQKSDDQKKRWGMAPIKNLFTDFQGLEISFFLKEVVPRLRQRKVRLLDLGCGGGNIPGFLKRLFPDWEIVGVDIDQRVLEMARKRFPQVEFIETFAHEIPRKTFTFDLVTSFDSLEHFEKLEETLREANRLLKEGGLFCLSVPLEKQFPTLYWFLYKLGWRGKKKFARHINFFNDQELVHLLEENGFRLIKRNFTDHLFFSCFDIGYYLIQQLLKREISAFETSVSELKPSLKKTSLTFFKKAIAMISFFESSILFWFPGGKGYYVFIKN
jgi:demethylmenaquinone methyltransferase/2-methoxy-6-polyprenyl-1,4-benzoquinol methylase